MDNKQLDNLTKQLMRESIEEPSPSLNKRIISVLLKERFHKRVAYIQSLPKMETIISFIIVYVIAAVGVMYYIQCNTAETERIISNLLNNYRLPILVLSIFVIFITLCYLMDYTKTSGKKDYKI